MVATRNLHFMRIVHTALAVSVLGPVYGCKVDYVMPDRAILLANPIAGEYASPPCVGRKPDQFVGFTIQLTRKEAKERGLRPAVECRNMKFGRDGATAGGFTDVGPDRATRWNPDGTWNW